MVGQGASRGLRRPSPAGSPRRVPGGVEPSHVSHARRGQGPSDTRRSRGASSKTRASQAWRTESCVVTYAPSRPPPDPMRLQASPVEPETRRREALSATHPRRCRTERRRGLGAGNERTELKHGETRYVLFGTFVWA